MPHARMVHRSIVSTMLVAVLCAAASSVHAADEIRIDEFNITCVNGFSNAAFVELTAAGPDQVYDNTIKLRFLNSNGTTRYEMPIGVGALAGQSWPQGRRWLIGYTNFFGTTQVVPDAEMTNVPATTGKVQLIRGTGSSATVLDSAVYVNNGATPAPTLGRSLQRQPDLSWALKSAPDPTTAAGILAGAASCFQATAVSARVNEMQLFCRNGAISGQFIELTSTGLSTTYDAAMRLRIFDRNDLLITEVNNLFGSATGQPWINGGEWLIGTPTLKGPLGQPADLTLPVALDTIAGRLRLVILRPDGVETILSDLRYGTPGLPRPSYGTSLSYSNGYSENPLPTPKGSNGAAYSDPLCERPVPSTAYLSELQLQCWNGSNSSQFIELKVHDYGEALWPELQLECLDHTGQSIGLITNLFGSLTRSLWPETVSWLIATSGFRDAQLRPANLGLPFTLDSLGGRLILRDLAAPAHAQVCSELFYGPGGVPAPAAGHSLEWTVGGYVDRVSPTPAGFTGLPFTDGICGRVPIAVDLRELQIRCANGSTSGQFLELGLRGKDEIFDPRIQVVFRDHNGVQLARMSQPFNDRTGLAWASAKAWLIASSAYHAPNGAEADAILPVPLDTLGGRIQLVQPVMGNEIILSQVHYGPGGTPLPAFGNSLSLSDGTYIESFPTPKGFNELSYSADAACSMPFQSGVVLEEVQLQCLNGRNEGQFIELRSTSSSERFDSRHVVRAYDRNDLLIGAVAVSAVPAGAAWPLDRSFLIANPAWRNDHGPDVLLPFALDVVAGRIELLGPYGASNSIRLATLSYGHSGELQPTPGSSFVRGSAGTYTASNAPTPNGFSGATYSAGRCSAPPIAQFQISEIGTSCFGGGNASFIELRSSAGAFHDDDVTLIARDHAGIEVGRLINFFGSYTGTSWPLDRRWLLSNEAFMTRTGFGSPTLPFALDPVGGELVLQQTVLGSLVTVDSVSYGPGREAPGPAPGMSISRATLGGVFAPSYPTPTSLQQTAVGSACFDPREWPIRISEFSAGCAGGGAAGQFIEIISLIDGFSYFSTLQLKLYDSTGQLIGASTAPFQGFASNPWPGGGTVLFGHLSGTPCTGVFDSALPAFLDTLGGRIELVCSTDGIEIAIQSLPYGSGTNLPAPTRGRSAQRQTDGTYLLVTTPTPKSRLGSTVTLPSCDVAPPPVRIERFALGCASGSSAGQFIELRSTATFVIPPTLVLTGLGGSQGQASIPAQFVGRIWVAGTSILFANSLWTTHLGRCADATIPLLDVTAGTLRLIDRSGPSCSRVVDEVQYGPGTAAPIPIPGVGLRREASGGWGQDVWPTPSCANGDTTWLVPCHSADPEQTVTIQEFALLDAGHSRRTQFIELTASRAGQMSDRRVGVRTFDASGALIQDIQGSQLQLFGGLWRPGVPHMLAANNTVFTGNFIDALLAPLDTLGGRIELLYQPSYGGPRQLLSALTYGTAGGIAAPRPGYSAQRMPDGSYSTTARPTPANILGPLPMTSYPVAGCEIASLISSTGENEPVGTPAFDRLQTIAPTRSTFDKARGTVSSSAGPGMTATTTATDRYALQAPLGAAVQVVARMRAVANMLCDSSGCAQGATSFGFILNGATFTKTLSSTGTTLLDLPIVLTAGTPFTLSQQVIATQSPGPGFTRRVFADAQLEFVGIPAGMKITSCSGYLQDQPVPVLLALAEAVAAADHARLVWRVDQSAAFEARVQRREEGSEWLDLGTVSVDGAGQLEFTDGSVVPLHRYGYRLTWIDRERGAISAGEAWLDIPRALAFALHGARPNPSRGALTVAFQLATEGEVRIELLDIAGRRVLEHRVDRMAPGDHVLSLARAGEVAPGMYALRLKQGERSATTRVIVTR